MKIYLSKILLFCFVLLSCNEIGASTNPPQPIDPLPPPPLPVDGYIMLLVTLAIVIAFYKIYSKIKKAN
ncbi:hypothetical protein [Flavobacterium sp.]|uniref:hypothetical protein n=1 Tax=Flavobacterium sp. TaxID=239 RepID=UPI003BBEE2FD